jgi:hypothetical protein
MKAFLMNDRLSPEIIFARDFRAGANVAAPAVEWKYSNDLQFKIGGNLKFGPSQNQHRWDDNRSGNAFIDAAAGFVGAVPNNGQSGGNEPLGRFRAGPIGTAFGQNEIFATMRYKF